MTAVPNNHVMGQANFPWVVARPGRIVADRPRPSRGWAVGCLGTACMLKMSPALLVVVLVAVVRREWVAAGSIRALRRGGALGPRAAAHLGFDVQLGFYTEVLPTFGSGWYNGLAVPIELFGNHSMPNMLDNLFRAAKGTRCRPIAQAMSTVTLAVGLGSAGLGCLVHQEPRRSADRARRDQQRQPRRPAWAC